MGIVEAQKKYAAKTAVMAQNYTAGMSGFLGMDVSGSLPVANYRSKINPQTAAKWATNLKGAFGVRA